MERSSGDRLDPTAPNGPGFSAHGGRDPGAYLPTASPAGTIGSAWFCAGGTATAGGAADHEVFLVNVGDTVAHATVTVYPSDGAAPRALAREVPPRYRSPVRLGDLVTAPFAAAAVEVAGGQVVVEHRVSGPLGYDLAPCAASASDRWYFPGGDTLLGDDMVLALFNPFPADATVDIAFVTDGADLDANNRAPRALQGLPVPGRSLVVVRVADQVSRRSHVVTTVKASAGQVVVDQLQTYGGNLAPPNSTGQAGQGAQPGQNDGDTTVSLPPPGVTVHLGVPRPATSWIFPDGRKTDGAHESYVVYNPSDRPANVDVSMTLDDPAANPAPAPFEITGLAPGAFQVVELDKETRVPNGVDHSAVVRSLNGVPVVAQRLLYAAGPWSHAGAAATTGSPVTATTWVLATGTNLPTTDEQVVVFNPSHAMARIRVRAVDSGKALAPAGPATFQVGPGRRLTVPITSLKVQNGDLATVVTSDKPVVVERTLLENNGVGISSNVAVPLPDGAQRGG